MLQELQRKRNVTISTKFYFAPIPVLFQNVKRLDFDEPSRLPYTYQVVFSSCVITWELNWCGFNTEYYCQSVFPILVPPSLRKSFLQISTLTCFRSDKSSAGYFGWPYVDDDSTGTVTLTSWWGKKRFIHIWILLLTSLKVPCKGGFSVSVLCVPSLSALYRMCLPMCVSIQTWTCIDIFAKMAAWLVLLSSLFR